MRIAESARKHDIADEDILHAVRMTLVEWDTDEEGFTMLTGPGWNGSLLEIGVLHLDSDDPVAIHAMPCRPQYIP